MAMLLKQPKTDILLTHDWLMFPVFMALLNLLRGTQYILISNSLIMDSRKLNHWPAWRIGLYKRLFQFALEHSHAIVCNSYFLKCELSKLFPQLDSEMCAIHNGINNLPSSATNSFDYPTGINFLTITNFEFSYKFAGLDLIFESLELSGINSVNLYILGKAYSKRGFENLEKFKAKVMARYKSTNTYIIPNADVFSFFQPENAVFLYSSGPGGDSLPRAILEAQAMGMPSVIVNTNGCAEAVIPNQSAIVVEPDAKELALGIQRILDPEFDRQSMGEIARRNISENFTWERMAEQYAAIFHSVGGNVNL
jgi:glycosyltransferase involved in cell wall biosynthesis